jgi:hypothetical protein
MRKKSLSSSTPGGRRPGGGGEERQRMARAGVEHLRHVEFAVVDLAGPRFRPRQGEGEAGRAVGLLHGHKSAVGTTAWPASGDR